MTFVSKIPLTDLRSLYGMFDLFSSMNCQRAMAEETLRDNNPWILAEKFKKSVEHFSRYSNIEEPFYPDAPARKDLPDPERIDSIGDTLSMTAFLKSASSAHVLDNPGLDFSFVDREVVPARTTGNAVFENDQPSRHVRRLDWLLANAQDRLPIIAEVKVGDDKNPFYALIQLLMYAAELATSNQLNRLQRHYPKRFAFPALNGSAHSPVMDIYIVLSNYNARSGIRQEILEMTNQLCQRLVGEEAISKYIRRIACLNVTLEADRKLRFTKLFSYADA